MSNIIKVSNTEYHANRTHLSSSMLKLLLQDPQKFYRQWFLGEKQEDKPAFAEGSLTHTLCLEPEKIDEYAVYPGLRRRGKEWDEFSAANADKTIVTQAQMLRAEKYFEACMQHSVAAQLLSEGHAEFTMQSNLLDVPVKARADYINWPKQYIVDLKTTSQPGDIELFKHTCKEYSYDLSAALYCDIAAQTFGYPFDFYWIVISKLDFTVEVYKASKLTLAQGSESYKAALALYKRCLVSGQWTHENPKKELITEYEVLEV